MYGGLLGNYPETAIWEGERLPVPSLKLTHHLNQPRRFRPQPRSNNSNSKKGGENGSIFLLQEARFFKRVFKGSKGSVRPMAESSLRETVEQARTAVGSQLENLLYHRSREVLDALLDNPRLREQHLIVMLARKDLSREVVTRIAQNREWMKSYSLKTAVLKHPRTPRHLALPLLKFVYLFDLMAIAATPGASPDLKRLAEDAVLAQREGLALGQRLSLARRGSHRVAAGLLLDSDQKVIRAALDNPSMTDQSVSAALLLEKSGGELANAVATHSRWSVRRSVKLALVRSRHLSLARFASLLPDLSLMDLRDLMEDRRVAPNLRAYVAKIANSRRLRMRKKEYNATIGGSHADL
jgi:predicted HTH domain antitoxin